MLIDAHERVIRRGKKRKIKQNNPKRNEVRDISGKPMDVKVDSLNFSVGQTNGELNVSFNTKIAIKPK